MNGTSLKFYQGNFIFCKISKIALLLVLMALINGCTTVISLATSKMSKNLSTAILNSSDPQTVADGAPAYLLFLSSFVHSDTDDEDLLQSAANLYSAYAGVFVKDKKRAAKMTTLALDYALRSVCANNSDYCNLRKSPFDTFKRSLNDIEKDDVLYWYTLGSAWAGWVQTHSQDWNAVAELARIKAIFARLLEIKPDYKQGGVHLYMAVLSTLLPPALGGKPETGKKHFEQALALSNNKNLMAKVLYAEKYARLIFNKALHDKLLNEVLQADPVAQDLTLMNSLAQQKAKELLASGAEYF